MRVKVIIACALAMIAVALAWMAVQFNSPQTAPSIIPSSALAPDFTWRDFDDAPHTLKEFPDRVIVVHFWASWCAPCREEFPKLLTTANTLQKNVVFLVISSDEDRNKALQFIRRSEEIAGLKKPANVFYAWDPKKTIIYDIFQTARYPETIVLDPTGHMRRKFPGSVAWDSRDVLQYLKD